MTPRAVITKPLVRFFYRLIDYRTSANVWILVLTCSKEVDS